MERERSPIPQHYIDPNVKENYQVLFNPEAFKKECDTLDISSEEIPNISLYFYTTGGRAIAKASTGENGDVYLYCKKMLKGKEDPDLILAHELSHVSDNFRGRPYGLDPDKRRRLAAVVGVTLGAIDGFISTKYFSSVIAGIQSGFIVGCASSIFTDFFTYYFSPGERRARRHAKHHSKTRERHALKIIPLESEPA